jgi:hypothetical protein
MSVAGNSFVKKYYEFKNDTKRFFNQLRNQFQQAYLQQIQDVYTLL